MTTDDSVTIMWELLFLLLPLAAFSGWFIGRKTFSHRIFRKLIHSNLTESNNTTLETLLPTALPSSLESTQETVETHLALGGLFRRRGEVGKAIGIHQNLIEKSTLTEEQRALSLLELSRDYMRAGVLDRAETVLLELIEEGLELEAGYHHLLEIYQQSKDWQRAIEVAEKWQTKTKRNMTPQIAHFYCELAEQQWLKGEKEHACHYLKLALDINVHCVRANLLLGNIETQLGHYKIAIKAFKKIQKQDPSFLSEIILPLARCYEHIENTAEMIDYIEHCFKKYSTTAAILVFSDWLYKIKGESFAMQFVIDHLKENPTLQGLSRLIQFSMIKAEGNLLQDLSLCKELIEKMLLNKPLYRCQACGFSGRTLQWQCPSCKRWDVIKPITN